MNGAGRSAALAALGCLLSLAALALGACANPDSVQVAQVDCHASRLQVGAVCGGGIVYAVNYEGQGIVLAFDPQPYHPMPWGPIGTISRANDAYDGRNNTGTFDPAFGPSWFCQQHIVAHRVDWYLPSANELGALVQPSSGGAVPSLPFQPIWSSTQDVTPNALAVDFSAGPLPVSQGRGTALPVVCIRRPVVAPD